jgi:microcystin-dependent protein
MPGNVEISSSSIPVGLCLPFTDAQWQLAVSLLSGTADVSPNIHKGEAPPTDLTKTWRKTISGVPDKFYDFASGVWLARHDWADRIGGTMLAPAGLALADIDTFDGGEAGPVTAFTGPMWARDTDFDAMFPIGPGTLPSGAALVEGATGGEEKHALTTAELAPHSHVVLASMDETGGGTSVNRLRTNITEADSDVNTADTGGDPVTPGLYGVPHGTMPPFRVRFFLRKTARTHYRS